MTCPYYGLFSNRALTIAVIVLIVVVGALLFRLRTEVKRRRTAERKLVRTLIHNLPSSAFRRLRADLLSNRPPTDFYGDKLDDPRSPRSA